MMPSYVSTKGLAPRIITLCNPYYSPSMGEDVFSARMQNILHIANRLKEVTTVSNSPSHPPIRTGQSSVAIDSIHLPSPRPLLPSLLEAGAGHEIAAAASKIYELRAEELRKYIQESIVTAGHKIAELPVVASASSPDLLIRKVVSSATEVYLQRLGQWKEEIVQRVKQASQSPVNTVPPTNSRTFNHVSIPITQLRPFPIYLAGICSTIGALFRRKPIPDASRQDFPCQKVKYGIQANSCMGKSSTYLIVVSVVGRLTFALYSSRTVVIAPKKRANH